MNKNCCPKVELRPRRRGTRIVTLVKGLLCSYKAQKIEIRGERLRNTRHNFLFWFSPQKGRGFLCWAQKGKNYHDSFTYVGHSSYHTNSNQNMPISPDEGYCLFHRCRWIMKGPEPSAIEERTATKDSHPVWFRNAFVACFQPRPFGAISKSTRSLLATHQSRHLGRQYLWTDCAV